MTESMIEKTLSAEENNKEMTNDTQEMNVQKEQIPPQSQPQQPSDQNDYEKSVTEKENLLFSINKLSLNNNNMVENNNNINLLMHQQQNGKTSVDSSDSSPQHDPANDLIMDETNVTSNSHEKNNSIDNVL